MHFDCPCRADTAITFQWTGHEFVSSGGKDRVGIRGLSEIALFDFDLKAVLGRVVSATLILTNPPDAEGQLPAVTVSTIRAPWVEGTAPDYELCAGASSFQYRVTESETSGQPWAWRGSLFPDVVLGRGGSIWFPQILPDQGRFDAQRQIRIDIPSAVIERCRRGLSHGFAIFDDRGARDVFTRPYSRHTATPPRLIVLTADEPALVAPLHDTIPASVPPGTLTAVAEDLALETDAAVRITGALPMLGHAAPIGYRAELQSAAGVHAGAATSPPLRPLELWRIPEPPVADATAPAHVRTAEFDLIDLPIAPGDQLIVHAIDLRGRESAPTAVALVPRRPDREVSLTPIEITTAPLGPARLGVLLPGESLRGDGQAVGYTREKPEPLQVIWKEGDLPLKLEALAGEVLDLPLVIQTAGGGIIARLEFNSELPAAQGVALNAGLAAFVQSDAAPVPDSIQPLTAIGFTGGSAAGSAVGPAAGPAAGRAREFKLQRPFELLYCDLSIWPQAAGRTLKSILSLTLGGQTIALPLEITVLPAALPQTTSFVVELNSYNKFHRHYQAEGDFAADEWNIQLDYHRQAHRHRCNFNVLPYSQMGTILCDSAPRLSEGGHIADWSAWDKRYLPLLTGAAFTDGPRAGIPVTYFYLPIHENWPGDFRKEYRFNLPIGTTRADYLKALKEHATIAPAIETAFEPTYAPKLWQTSFEFSRHLSEQRLRPASQGGPIVINYFNNKHIYKDPERVEGVNHRIGDLAGTAWWLLDEPNDWSDWLALRYFGDIVRDGFRQGGATIEWCLDLSRPEWDRDLLAGQRDLVRASSVFFKYPRLIKRWKKQGSRVLHYGSANSPESKPLRETVWAWQIWSRGGDGILPWSATPMEGFSDGGWLQRPDKLSVIVPVREEGRWSRPSLRLKAFRRGQQDAELCLLAAQRNKIGRAVLGREILQHLGQVKTQAGSFIDEATSIESPDLTAARLEALRRAVRRLAANVP